MDFLKREFSVLSSTIDILNLSILVGKIYYLMLTLRNSISCLSNPGPEPPPPKQKMHVTQV